MKSIKLSKKFLLALGLLLGVYQPKACVASMSDSEKLMLGAVVGLATTAVTVAVISSSNAECQKRNENRVTINRINQIYEQYFAQIMHDVSGMMTLQDLAYVMNKYQYCLASMKLAICDIADYAPFEKYYFWNSDISQQEKNDQQFAYYRLLEMKSIIRFFELTQKYEQVFMNLENLDLDFWVNSFNQGKSSFPLVDVAREIQHDLNVISSLRFSLQIARIVMSILQNLLSQIYNHPNYGVQKKNQEEFRLAQEKMRIEQEIADAEKRKARAAERNASAAQELAHQAWVANQIAKKKAEQPTQVVTNNTVVVVDNKN